MSVWALQIAHSPATLHIHYTHILHTHTSNCPLASLERGCLAFDMMNKINQGILIQLWAAKYQICIESVFTSRVLSSTLSSRQTMEDVFDKRALTKTNLSFTQSTPTMAVWATGVSTWSFKGSLHKALNEHCTLSFKDICWLSLEENRQFWFSWIHLQVN